MKLFLLGIANPASKFALVILLPSMIKRAILIWDKTGNILIWSKIGCTVKYLEGQMAVNKIFLIILVVMSLLPLSVHAQSPVKLSCSLGQDTIILDIDYGAHKVNGIRADFSEDMIIWGYNEPSVPSSTSYYLNRYTSDIKRQVVGANDYPGTFTYGKCQKVTERQF